MKLGHQDFIMLYIDFFIRGDEQCTAIRVSNMTIVMDEQTGLVVSAEDHDTDCAKVLLPLTLLRYTVLNVQTVSWL